MCDSSLSAMYGAQAVGSIASGIAGMISAGAQQTFAEGMAIDARSRATLEAAQLDAMKVLGSAAASEAMGDLEREMMQKQSANIAAMAVSGLDPLSFQGVQQGNENELKRAKSRIFRADELQRQMADIQIRERILAGEMEAAGAEYQGMMAAQAGWASLYAGFMGAVEVGFNAQMDLKEIGWMEPETGSSQQGGGGY